MSATGSLHAVAPHVQEYPHDLFVPAAVIVFNMVESDVYRRFQVTQEYKDMVRLPDQSSAD